MTLSKVRRWHFLECFLDKSVDERFGVNDPKAEAEKTIKEIQEKGFKSKIWAPLPQHKTSGHVHVVVLCTWDELFKLVGLE